MYIITVEFVVKEANLAEFMEAMLRQATSSLDLEADCHQFDVCQDLATPSRVFLYEAYTDEPAFQAHLATNHFKSFSDIVGPWVADKTVNTWNRVSA